MRKELNPRVPSLKKVIKRAGFFTYYFKHRSKIKKMNILTGLINFSSFGFDMSLNMEFKKRLDLLFFNHIHKLSKHIKHILKNGWRIKFISIWDYNVIVNFKNFYDKFYQVIKGDDIAFEDFLRLERAYVKISYRSNYTDSILAVFTKYLRTENKLYEDDPEVYDELLEKLEQFFDSSLRPFSLRDLILTYNMTRYRTFLTWGELFPPLSYDIVQDKFYNCTIEVYNKVMDHYKKINKTIRSLQSENEELLRLKENCNIDKIETPPMIIQFYTELNHNWKVDKSNYYLLFLMTIQGVIERLDTLIFKSWDLLKENEVQVHRRLITDKELPQLYRKLKREFDVAFQFLNDDTSVGISIEEFRLHQNPLSLANSEAQKKMFVVFDYILEVIFEISQILLAYSDIAADSGYTKNSYFRYMLNAPEEWVGKPVFALFNYNIELLWTICAFFRYKVFWNLKDRLLEINKALQDLTEEKKRLDAYNIIDDFLLGNSSAQESNVEEKL